ncbi:glycosyltransferase [uncultured Microbacterium sp.]|uniref:glycosyltransferase n=1 Tax=uncultured Microbacterium sp. TaxID=191216 RepID=UPI0035CAD340
MSTYLLTCTPAHGHVMPLLAVTRHLVADGHSVRFLTGSRYAERVRAAGAVFLPLPAEADIDLDDADAAFPDRRGLTGPAALRYDIVNLFLRPGRAQYDALTRALAEVPTAAVLTEQLFIGAGLLAELPRDTRPPVVVLGIFPLGVASADTAPFGLGVAPLGGIAGRVRNAVLTFVAEKIVFGPVAKEAAAVYREVVGVSPRRFVLDWASGADALVQFTVPEFEYPRSDLPEMVSFVGPLPSPAGGGDLPEWWGELDGQRPIVHVTQGTVANADVTQLFIPAMRGLAASDALVVVSTGGRPIDVLGELPGNVRAAEYLPYDRLLPLVDVMVTNGGYGGVQQALSHGIPLVVAGQTEDKIEVSARIGWSGAGVNLKTSTPTADAVAAAVDRVLGDPSFRANAQRIGGAIAAAPGLAGLDSVLANLGAAEVLR